MVSPRKAQWIRAPIAPKRLDLSVQGGRSAAQALRIYRPLRPFSRVAARANVMLAAMGLGRRVQEPVSGLEELAREIGLPYDAAAAFRSSAPGRHILGLAWNRRLLWVLKVGSVTDLGLQREAEALERLAQTRMSVRMPRLIWYGVWRAQRVVVTEASPDAAVYRADLFAIAALCTELCRGPYGRPLAHGDLAPWNLLEWRGHTYLVDWEHWRAEFDPLYDLAHYVVRAGAFLGWFSPEQAAAQLTEHNSPGWRHLKAIGVEPTTAAHLVADYLRKCVNEPAPVRSFQRQLLESLE